MGLGIQQKNEVSSLIQKAVDPFAEKFIELTNRVNKLEIYNELLCRKYDDLDQYNRRTNLVLHGIPFSKIESPITIKNQIVHELNQLGLKHIIPYLDRAHRYGARRKDTQAVILRFTTWNARNEFFKARKNSKFQLQADLTSRRLELLAHANDYIASERCEGLFKYAFADRNCILQIVAVDGSFHAFSSETELGLIANRVEDKCKRISHYYEYLRSFVAPWVQKCGNECSDCADHFVEPPARKTQVIGIKWYTKEVRDDSCV